MRDPNATNERGLERANAIIIRLEKKAESLPRVSSLAEAATVHRPYSPKQLAHGFVGEFRVDYDLNCAKVSVEDRVKQVEITSVFYRDVYNATKTMFQQQEKTDDMDLLPEYIQALRNCGHMANLVVCGATGLRERLVRLVNREYQKSRQQNPALPDDCGVRAITSRAATT